MSKYFVVKALYIFILISLPFAVFPQQTLQNATQSIRGGDLLYKQQLQYKDPGRSGTQVLWDFSRLEAGEASYPVRYTALNDFLITGTERITHYAYLQQGDSLLLVGFTNPTTVLKNIRPEVLLTFPFAYGDSIQTPFYAHGKYANRLEMDVMGTVETVANASGMMILPSRDTLKNVLRTRTLKLLSETTQNISDTYYSKRETPLTISDDSISIRLATDSVLFVTETYRWYARGYRYPVFETVRSWEQSRSNNGENEFVAEAFFFPPEEQVFLEDDEANVAIRNEITTNNDPWAGLTYNIYPNPVNNLPLEVEIYLPKPADIHAQMRNSMGHVVWNQTFGSYPAGTVNFQIPCAGLPVNNYILDIWLNEHLISSIIMKR